MGGVVAWGCCAQAGAIVAMHAAVASIVLTMGPMRRGVERRLVNHMRHLLRGIDARRGSGRVAAGPRFVACDFCERRDCSRHLCTFAPLHELGYKGSLCVTHFDRLAALMSADAGDRCAIATTR